MSIIARPVVLSVPVRLCGRLVNTIDAPWIRSVSFGKGETAVSGFLSSPELRNRKTKNGVRVDAGMRWLSVQAASDMVSMVQSKNAENPVVVYSKTYCPFCMEVKSLFNALKIPAKIIELDNLEDGDAVQGALLEITGRRTVPQVFVGGENVGGCDETMTAHKNGTLKEMLTNAGIAIEG